MVLCIKTGPDAPPLPSGRTVRLQKKNRRPPFPQRLCGSSHVLRLVVLLPGRACPARGYAREPNDLLRGESAPVIEKGGAFQVVTAQIPTAKNMAATARKKAIICSAFFP